MNKTLILSLILSILPISELRGAIPYAYLNGLTILQSYLLCTFANILVSPIGFLFFSTIHKFLNKWKFYNRIITTFIERSQKKVGPNIHKYGLVGLMLFVAIPLPITGAWTGTIGAWFLNLDRKKSIIFISLGVIIAGIIVSIVVITGAKIGKIFIKTI